jgi:ribosomal protein S18 acetylase RimI-like enzyme
MARTGNKPIIEVLALAKGDAGLLGRVLAASFAEDEALRRFVACRPDEFPRYFDWISHFFLESGRYLAWGAYQGNDMVGAALCIPSRWRVPPRLLVHHLRRAWQIHHARSLIMGLNMLRYATLAGYGGEGLSLTFLGVLPQTRKLGIGRLLLRHVLERSPFSIVQLEVETLNQSAISLYLSEGFSVLRRFRVAAMEMQMMQWRKPLPGASYQALPD